MAMSESYREHIWIVALFEQEARADELLHRLHALGIDTSEATTLRVEIDEHLRTGKFSPVQGALSPTIRGVITGALTGGALALVMGLVLYGVGWLKLPFLAGVFHHAVASVLAGAVFGAIAGSILGSAREHRIAGAALTKMRQLKNDGYLVTVKMPPSFAEQAEEIARGLGAKEILL